MLSCLAYCDSFSDLASVKGSSEIYVFDEPKTEWLDPVKPTYPLSVTRTQDSIRSLIWALVLLAIIIYAFVQASVIQAVSAILG